MKIKNLIAYSFLLFASLTFAQNTTVAISGVIIDSLKRPIPNATLIAKSYQEKVKIKYVISNSKGSYKLQLNRGVVYELSISHLGYNTLKKEVRFLKNNANYMIQLNTKNEPLEEVVIHYKYQPIQKNKDTISYNLKAFTNGNEFKMKEVLGKLPGVKVDEDVIKIQGKTVTKLLVEGKPFFNGSAKLAIDNIPADVMAKIEIISNYKESELLRNLADNEDLALNVVLKEDRKDFAFGDAEAGAGVDGFYSLHAALFKYNPKSNISCIVDTNNFNNSSLSFSDLSRLVGGSSNLFRKNSVSTNLLNFASNNKERFKSTTRFTALNFQYEFNDKFNVTGYAIHSNNDIINKSISTRAYLGNQPIIEIRNDLGDTNNNSALFNVKLDYNPSSTKKWMYKINYLYTASDYSKESISNVEDRNQFFTNIDGKNDRFAHNLEGYFKLNDRHTLGIALEHSIANAKSTDNWSSNAIFLEEFLPFTPTTNYQINQINDVKAQRFHVLLKDYWLASRYYHLFYSIGFNYKESRIRNDISQILTNNATVDFSDIGNNNPLTLSDLNFGLGIKFKLKKFEFILEAKPHYFKFDRAQIKNTNFFIEPKLTVNYKIDNDIDLDFNYGFANRYLNDLSYLENLKVTGFNTMIRGNPNLTDERSHNFSLYYSNYKNIDDHFMDASIDYSIMNPVKNISIVQSEINQLNTPVVISLPEKNLNFNTNYGLIFNRSSLEFDVDLDWLRMNQVLNEEVRSINSFEYSLSSKWIFKLSKRIQLNLKYEHSGYQVRYDNDSHATESIFFLNVDSKFLKNFIFKTDLSTHFVNDFSEVNQNYTLQNLYLGYVKPNSHFSYSLHFRNIYDNGLIMRNSFGLNLLMSKQIFTLPRVFLFELKYKF